MSDAPALPEQNFWELFDVKPLFSSGIEGYLHVALGRCVGWFRASGGSIFLNQDGGLEFKVRSRHGLQTSLPGDSTFQLGEGIAGIVAKSGQARIIDDPLMDSDLVAKNVQFNSSIVSAMVIPLLAPDRRAMGVLNISRTIGEPNFETSDLRQAETLAAHVALAVSNAQMIHDLRQKMDESKLSNEKLVAVLDSVAGAVVVVDSQGQVVNHNKAASEESFTGPWQADEGSVLKEGLNIITEEVTQGSHSVAHRAYDELSDRTWLMEAIPLLSGGGVITVRETTELDRQQRDVDRVRRLAEIGQMTAAIAHEIRNPLTGIRSAAHLMSQHPDMMSECRDMIDEEVMKLNDLCEDFLDFARPLSLNLTEVCLPDLVRKVCMLMSLEFAEKGVTLTWNPSTDQPTMKLDGRRIEHVVFNLVRNGLQATPPGGEVKVGAEGHRFWVMDNGQGMSQEQLSKLFSPFFTTKARGTGLGLCNVHKVVDALQGKITVESEPGHGSCFEVSFDRRVA